MLILVWNWKPGVSNSVAMAMNKTKRGIVEDRQYDHALTFMVGDGCMRIAQTYAVQGSSAWP